MTRFITLLLGMLGSTVAMASGPGVERLDLTASWVGYAAIVVLRACPTSW